MKDPWSIDPATSCMQNDRSTFWANLPEYFLLKKLLSEIIVIEKN